MYKFFCVQYLYDSEKPKICCYKCQKEDKDNIELLCVSGFGVSYLFDQEEKCNVPICSRCGQKFVVDDNNTLSVPWRHQF